ncbi:MULTISPECIES: class I SAM-dependent methyltransferase [Parafrankia]|uniref:Ubiquinone biosynthesis protein n=1 Tax=Parafrankia soli TaxID=2599596 RepID=A0A1S1PFM7_9ACTN|nr:MULTISPECIES: class I SAM-dependent methyltransferase [Parafrankia]OHV19755.1 ubiquinone biosynthesis protein [Parafrankia soli]TCJ34453.1 class I SAM-dependent methyltransferase [Parafrankia sp. BMG5.11]CAI7975863.1 Class I SAM-dependent methyltransferase [Frankia sp. Hr75.2]SQE00027.1 Methyltransferase type 11 [Parafrankia sp. Ea1.12]
MSSLRDDALAYAGHQVHVMRRREVGTLLSWAGDLHGRTMLDVAGGDGYWAGQAVRRGARAVSLDLARHKLDFGSRLKHRPSLVEGDALRLPFAPATFDIVMSVCAIEHFDDGPAALAEMARVLRPGGDLVMSADALTRADRWPDLFASHRERYHVQHTYPGEQLTKLLADAGLEVVRQTYMFRSERAERLYLNLSAKGGRIGWNAAAVFSPLVALSDRRAPDTTGSVVLTHARRRQP